MFPLLPGVTGQINKISKKPFKSDKPGNAIRNKYEAETVPR